MLIISKEFIDCLKAIHALPVDAKRELEAMLDRPHFLFPGGYAIGCLTEEGNKAFAMLEALLSTLPEEYKAKIPAYKSAEDKLRVLEFVWLWWKGVQYNFPDYINSVTSIYHSCNLLWTNCTATLTSVIVERNHPVLLQLAIEKFGKSLAVGIKPSQIHKPLGHLYHLLSQHSNAIIWQEIFQIFARAIAEDKIKMPIDNLIALLKKARKVKHQGLTQALLIRAKSHTARETHSKEDVLLLLDKFFSIKENEFFDEFVTNWHTCLKDLACDPKTILTFVVLALSVSCQPLLDIALERLQQHKFMIDFPALIFAKAHGMGGMALVNQLKMYHGGQEELRTLPHREEGLPLYSINSRNHIDIGHGSFAYVWSAVLRGDNQQKTPVAVKSFKHRIDDITDWQRKELTIFRRLGQTSENVVKLHGLYTEQASPFWGLVLEYAFFGDLTNFRLSLKNPSDALQHQIATDCAKGLAYCHAQQVVHNDVKPHNILVRLNEDGTFTFCVADFGLSYVVNPNKRDANFRAGSAQYQSPEKILGHQAIDPRDAPKVDVWAFAGILHFLIYGRNPWSPELDCRVKERLYGLDASVSDEKREMHNVLTTFICENKLPAIPEDKPCDGVPSIASVMHACFFRDPKQRISSQELVGKLATPYHFKC